MYLLRFILVFVYLMLVIVYTSFPVQVLQGLHKFLCIGVIPPVKVDYEESLGSCNP